MKVLVTGVSGFLGWHVARHLAQTCDIVPVAGRTRVPFGSRKVPLVEITDAIATHDLILRTQPTHVVHCAAMSKIDECQNSPGRAMSVNADGTDNLLRATREVLGDSAPFISLSTDLVFDGRKSGGMYTPDDATNSLSEYGRTKLAGEDIVRDDMARGGVSMVLRSALMFGLPGAPRESFLGWLIEGLQKGEVSLFEDEFRTPVFAQDLCTLITSALMQPKAGVYHAGGDSRLSRADMGRILIDALAMPESSCRVSSAASLGLDDRPRDVSLDSSATCEQFQWQRTPTAEALALCAQKFAEKDAAAQSKD